MPEWLDILLKILFIPIILWPITFFILAIFLMERSIKKHEKERKESLLNLAKTKNLKYSDKLSSLPLTTIEHSLFNPKINKIENLNILSGLAEGIEFFIVDQRFKQHKNTKFACACILKKDFLDFPMTLRDDNLYHFLAMLTPALGFKIYQPKVYTARYLLVVLVPCIPFAPHCRIAYVGVVDQILMMVFIYIYQRM